MPHLLAPSMLSANFANLAADTEMVNASMADWFHIDIMDGVFVPNISFGFPVMKAIKALAKKPFDVHLMIVEPDRYIDQFRDAGADHLTVHFEACTHLHRTLQRIRDTGMKAGVAINPHTPVSSLSELLGDIDIVCMMSVNPGFGGQKFIANTYDKISRLRKMIDDNGHRTLIEIDGGVELGNYRQLIDRGADVLVAGNAVFSSKDPSNTIALLKN